jgi:hypothetical protein
MIRREYGFAFVLLLMICVSCNDKKNISFAARVKSIFSNDKSVLSVNEMKEFVVNVDHGLLKSKQIDEVTYSAKYKPVDYIIAMETRDEKLTRAIYKEKHDELSGLQYFDLRIEIDKANGELLKYALRSGSQYESRVTYLAFDIKNDIKLVDGNDTLECVMSHFERVYDIVPYATILLGFKDTGGNLMHEKTLVFHDKLFGKGIIKFTFLPADLQTIPQLEVIS